jgi:hypothetical protein
MKKLYGLIPKKIQNRISYLSVRTGVKPRAMKDDVEGARKFPKGFKGGVVFTGDFELGWAVGHSRRKPELESISKTERENMPKILDIMDKYGIPITWATVGHLLLSECSKGEHDWMSRIPHMNDHFLHEDGDWFDVDPYSNWQDAPLWYAPDLVEMIRQSPVKHEIGCHTFSHVDCRDEYCPAQVLDDELTACKKAAEKWGISFSSMAFPAGTAGNFPVLKKHGIKIYRRRIHPYELAYPYRDEWGLLVSPTGYGLGMAYPSRPFKDNLQRFFLAIDKAIRTQTVSHFWFHPSASPEIFEKLLPPILEYCAKKRDAGELWVGSMDMLQQHINHNQVI